MNQQKQREESVSCPHCQTIIAPGLLLCPGCQHLVYGEQLKQLASEAQRFMDQGQMSEALGCWRRAMDLLPANSQQAHVITQKINELSRKVDASGLKRSAPQTPMPPALMALGTVGILLWKFKFLLVMLLTKGKLLLLGLTKAQTFFSMVLAFGVYWSVWGWKFALGIILSIYIHEMGHVFALKKLGIPVNAPVFIPGVGAFIQLKSGMISPTEDARIGLAGPIAGLLAAIASYFVFLATGFHIWAAIAKFGAWVNLFNLLPFIPLDGGRGFHALSRQQKLWALAVIGGMWFWTHEGLLFLLLMVGGINAWRTEPSSQSDQRALVEYSTLVILLSLMSKYINVQV